MITKSPASERHKPDFEEVYEKYYSGVLSYIYKKTGSREDAEDLAGEAFLYCFDHYDSYDPDKSAVSTWLYVVANSRIKNYYRDKKSDVDITALEDFFVAEADDMDKAILLQQLRENLASALTALPSA